MIEQPLFQAGQTLADERLQLRAGHRSVGRTRWAGVVTDGAGLHRVFVQAPTPQEKPPDLKTRHPHAAAQVEKPMGKRGRSRQFQENTGRHAGRGRATELVGIQLHRLSRVDGATEFLIEAAVARRGAAAVEGEAEDRVVRTREDVSFGFDLGFSIKSHRPDCRAFVVAASFSVEDQVGGEEPDGRFPRDLAEQPCGLDVDLTGQGPVRLARGDLRDGGAVEDERGFRPQKGGADSAMVAEIEAGAGPAMDMPTIGTSARQFRQMASDESAGSGDPEASLFGFIHGQNLGVGRDGEKLRQVFGAMLPSRAMSLFQSGLRAAGFLLVATSFVSGAVLYDGSAGGMPSLQGLIYQTLPFPGSATQQQLAEGVRLDSTATTSDQAGYGITRGLNPAVPVMDRSTGFTVTFDLRLNTELHLSADRAGLSVIALGSDNRGIELAFWTDRIWAQSDSPLFQHAEEMSFNTSSGLLRYDLKIFGNVYTLSQGAATLLSGAVRDYSPSGNPVYLQQNFLFVGDDTTSAHASFDFAYLSVAPVPEPGSVSLLVAGLAFAGAVRRRARRARPGV